MTSKIITKAILAIATLSLSQSTSLHAQDKSGAQKEMPAKALEESYVNPSLRGTILHDDYDALVMCKEKALDILSTLGDSDYGIKNRKAVKKLLSQKEQEISLEDLHGHHRVRSIQVNNSGIFIYPSSLAALQRKTANHSLKRLPAANANPDSYMPTSQHT